MTLNRNTQWIWHFKYFLLWGEGCLLLIAYSYTLVSVMYVLFFTIKWSNNFELVPPVSSFSIWKYISRNDHQNGLKYHFIDRSPKRKFNLFVVISFAKDTKFGFYDENSFLWSQLIFLFETGSLTFLGNFGEIKYILLKWTKRNGSNAYWGHSTGRTYHIMISSLFFLLLSVFC